MVNKREKTRSLVYQMKEDIFHQEALLVDLEEKESSREDVQETNGITLPKFCHHSTGTVYDQPEGILKMAWLFEERAQQLDRQNWPMSSSEKLQSTARSKNRVSVDGSSTKMRRSRPQARGVRTDADNVKSVPNNSYVSPTQQLFRDKIDAFESGHWTIDNEDVKSELETSVKWELDSKSDELDDSVSDHELTVETVCSNSAKRFSTIGKAEDLPATCSEEEKDKVIGSGIESAVTAKVTQINGNDNVSQPLVNGTKESHLTLGNDDFVNNDRAPDSDVHMLDGHYGAVSTAKQDDVAKTDSTKAVKASTVKSTSRTERRKLADTIKKEPTARCSGSKFEHSPKSRVFARQQTEKEVSSLNELCPEKDEQNSSSSRRRSSKSDVKICDKIQPVYSKTAEAEDAPALLSQKSSLSTDHSVNAYEFVDTAVSKAESLKERPLTEATAKGQENPVLVSSPLNSIDGNTIKKYRKSQKISNDSRSKGAISRSSHMPLGSDTCKRPHMYFHAENFKPIETNEAKKPDVCSQETISMLNSGTSTDVDANGIVSAVDHSSTLNSNDSSKSATVSSVKDKRNKDKVSPSNAFMSEFENASKANLSVSRSRSKTPKVLKKSITVEPTGLPNTDRDGSAKKSGVTKKYTGPRKRRTSTVSTCVDLVEEKQDTINVKLIESHEGISKMSTEDVTYSLGSSTAAVDSMPADVESANIVQITDTQAGLTHSPLPSNGSHINVSDVNGRKLALNSVADPLKPLLLSSVTDNCTKSDISFDYLCGTDFIAQNTDRSSSSSVDFNNRSDETLVPGPKVRDLLKSSVNSRKRTAHLMAGCRSRTVGVKRAAPAIDKLPADQQLDADAHSVTSQPLEPGHLSPVEIDSGNQNSVTAAQPSLSDQLSSLQTESLVPNSVAIPTAAAESRQFYPASQPSNFSSQADLLISGHDTSTSGEPTDKNNSTQHSFTTVLTNGSAVKDNSMSNEHSPLLRYHHTSDGLSGPLHSNPESKILSPSVVLPPKDSRRESLRAELLRKFLPSHMMISEAVKRRVQDGLQLLSSMRSVPKICNHTRQKLVDYLNQSHKEAQPERLPLRPLDDKLEQSITSSRRQLPVRPHRRIYSEWEYVSGEELTSPSRNMESNSDSDYSVDFEDLAVSETNNKSSVSLARTKDRRLSTMSH